MLAELTIIPVGGDSHTSENLAEVLKLIDASGLSYQLTPTATCIEGRWEELMEIIRQCHERVRRGSPHVITMIKIEDEEGSNDKLRRNVASVEEKAGRRLQRTIPVTSEEKVTEILDQGRS
ncbi:MAG: MTH1187 family thiamine-binding protein [Deltaproteobacteria bacterium]|nr:MTH1187 family thiamine-binding protein [Deltaproteobacteria bacterium]